VTGRAPIFASLLLLAPAVARAQAVNGTAEWTVSRGSSMSDEQAYDNNSLWQRYTVDYQSFLLDPRFLKYNGELSYRNNRLTYGTAQAARDGRQSTFGYKVGAVAFPSRPFPFHFEIARDTIGESGDYPTTSGIRGGIVVPPDTALPDFRTRNTSLNVGWQLTVASLPRVEIGYRSASARITGGPYTAGQDNAALQVGVFKDSTRTRQALRYSRSSFENLVSNAFNQRLSDLDYELAIAMGKRSRFLTHAGRRNSFSLFDLPMQLVDPATQAYRPPSRGALTSSYVTSGVSFDPSSRFSLSLTGNAEHQDAQPVATSALLATTAARYDVVGGLSLNASGTYGQRGEVLQDAAVAVTTRSGQVGATYRAGARWLEGTVGGTRGAGSNTRPDGSEGRVNAWSGQGTLMSSFCVLVASAGYERQNNTDDILDYGNFDGRRIQGSIQAQGDRLSSMTTWERVLVVRGRSATLAASRQETFTATLVYRLGRESRVTGSAGGFANRADTGFDRTLFWGGAYEAQPYPRLHVSASLRRERTIATQTRLDQRGLRGYGQIEYRLRLFSFALEYRDDDQRLQFQHALQPLGFRGRQVLLRVSRKFGMRF
jgi:hypothetical protein